VCVCKCDVWCGVCQSVCVCVCMSGCVRAREREKACVRVCASACEYLCVRVRVCMRYISLNSRMLMQRQKCDSPLKFSKKRGFVLTCLCDVAKAKFLSMRQPPFCVCELGKFNNSGSDHLTNKILTDIDVSRICFGAQSFYS